MKDVAKDAHVSVATVSNYLNGKKVRPEVEEQVKRSIEKLHYVRNDAARALKISESKYVVFVLPTVWSPFFAELTFWIQRYLNEKGYKMILSISENKYEQEKSYVKMAEEQRVAGIISISYSDLNSHVPSNIPLVSIEKDDTGMFPLVTSDNYGGGKTAAVEFSKRGLKHLVYIGTSHEGFSPMIARQSGFIDQCNDLGIKYDIYDVPSVRNPQRFNEAIETVSAKIVESFKEAGPIGVFAYSDETALHLKSQIESDGLKVPDDIQIIGFDGGKLYIGTDLGISSIRQNVQEIALKTTELLDSQISGKMSDDIRRFMIPVSFKAGNTTVNQAL